MSSENQRRKNISDAIKNRNLAVQELITEVQANPGSQVFNLQEVERFCNEISKGEIGQKQLEIEGAGTVLKRMRGILHYEEVRRKWARRLTKFSSSPIRDVHKKRKLDEEKEISADYQYNLRSTSSTSSGPSGTRTRSPAPAQAQAPTIQGEVTLSTTPVDVNTACAQGTPNDAQITTSFLQGLGKASQANVMVEDDEDV